MILTWVWGGLGAGWPVLHFGAEVLGAVLQLKYSCGQAGGAGAPLEPQSSSKLFLNLLGRDWQGLAHGVQC